MSLARGDIVLVPFPFTDLTARKVRPGVIASPDPQGSDVLVAFISSSRASADTPTDWTVLASHPDFAQTGLKVPSVFKCGKLLTIHRSLILRRLGHVSIPIQQELDRRLQLAVGLAGSG